MSGKVSAYINICYAMAITLVGNLEVFTKDHKQRGVRTKIAIPQNKFVAEYEANVLTEDEAKAQEEFTLCRPLAVVPKSFSMQHIKPTLLGRLINHSTPTFW